MTVNVERKLSEKARELLDASDALRIAHIKSPLFLPYPRARDVLDDMEELLTHPRTNRMPNLLIIGPSDNGKTEILMEFLARHEAEARTNQDFVYAPVMYIQCPPKPDEAMFYGSLLMTLGEVPKPNDSAQTMLAQVLNVLPKTQVKVLLLDELHNLLSGPILKQRAFLTNLKYISNALGISFVAAGTKEAKQVILSIPELDSRFPMRPLPRWKDDEEFRRLLYTFEYTLPLRNRSDIHKGEIARTLYGLSDGLIGKLSKVLQSAAERAIVGGEEQITMAVINDCRRVRRQRDNAESNL